MSTLKTAIAAFVMAVVMMRMVRVRESVVDDVLHLHGFSTAHPNLYGW
jgi:hypothetical protein